MNKRSLINLIIALSVSTLSNYSLLFAETYQWNDADGSVHFTDNPINIPKGEQPIMRHERSNNIRPIPSERLTKSRDIVKEAPARENNEEKQFQKVDPKIKAEIQLVWKKLRDAIISGDTETALDQFVPGLQSQYRAMINDPSSNIVQRFKEIIRLEVYTVTGKAAQAGAIRKESEREYAYPVNFVNNFGEWKIYGM
jgi:hypothetical protein